MLPAIIVLAAMLPAMALLAGCASSSSGGQWTGPKKAAPVSTESWTYDMQSGSKQPGTMLKTQHYLIHTTINNKALSDRVAQVMEGAYGEYQSFAVAPQDGSISTAPMNCYVFAERSQWIDFTRRHTGPAANIYLQIPRGGYCIGDWFVAYSVGDDATYMVAAHEGWHQYVARHFKGQLPLFLEEGTACMFENVQFKGNLPRWDVSLNPKRALGLRSSIENNALWPLEKLVTMNAGDVVHLPGDKIESFYAQDWAFARFLWEYNNGVYRPKFKQLLADTAAGNAYNPPSAPRSDPRACPPASVKPMLEHYLGKSLPEIETEYRQFIRSIAYGQLNTQWMSKPG